MTTIKNFGLAGIGGDVQLGKGGNRLVSTGGVLSVTGTDGVTLSTLLITNGAGTNSAVTKGYVDTKGIGSLADVALTTLIDGQFLRYDNATGKWKNKPAALGDLSDVVTSTPTLHDIIYHNGSEFINGPILSAGIQAHSTQLDTLAGLTPSTDGFIVGNGTAFAVETGNAARHSLGLGTQDSPVVTGLTVSGGAILKGAAGAATLFSDVGSNTVTLGGTNSTTVVAGNLLVQGSVTTVNSTTLTVNADAVVVNHGGSTASAMGAGINIEGDSAAIVGWLRVNGTDNGKLELKSPTGSNLTLKVTANTEIDLAAATAGQTIRFDGSKFVNSKLAIEDLSNVVLTSPTSGAVLSFDGSNWVNGTVTVITALAGLSDVTLTSPTANQYLRYDGSKWVNVRLQVQNDTTPVLGGHLDANVKNITNAAKFAVTSGGYLDLLSGFIANTNGTAYSGGTANAHPGDVVVHPLFSGVSTAIARYYGTAGSNATAMAANISASDGNAIPNKLYVDNAITSGVGAATLAGLTDVNIGTLSAGNYLRYNGSKWVNIDLAIVDDTTPQLGGNLDVNGHNIVAATGNIQLSPVSGNVVFTAPLTTLSGDLKLHSASGVIQLGGGLDLNGYAIESTVSSGGHELQGIRLNPGLLDTVHIATSSVSAVTYAANVTDNNDIPNKLYVDQEATSAATTVNGSNVISTTLNSTFTTTASTHAVGTLPNIKIGNVAKAPIVNKVAINVTTPVSGGSVTQAKVVDTTANIVLMDFNENDILTAGVYVADLPTGVSTATGDAIQIQFFQANGTTAGTPTAGAMEVAVFWDIV